MISAELYEGSRAEAFEPSNTRWECGYQLARSVTPMN